MEILTNKKVLIVGATGGIGSESTKLIKKIRQKSSSPEEMPKRYRKLPKRMTSPVTMFFKWILPMLPR
jgi:NADPH:quinone reductase-like Zn-dependent oxidoreductase